MQRLTEWCRSLTRQDAWNVLLVIFTGTLAVVAVQQYYLTKRQVHVSEVAEKAYVSFDSPIVDLDTAKPFSLLITLATRPRASAFSLPMRRS
jgi:hypothetical protein